jgi:hypothetical protein
LSGTRNATPRSTNSAASASGSCTET